MRCIYFMALMLLVVSCKPATTPPEGSVPDFQKALDAHLQALADRDMMAYEQTVTKKPTLNIIFPDGSRSKTRAEALAFHDSWFTNPDWRMTLTEEWRSETATSSVVFFRTAYQDTPDGPERAGWLTLYFEIQDSVWQLVHDQNTRIVPPAE